MRLTPTMETGRSTRKPINPHLATLRDSFAVMLEDFARGRGLYDARTLRILHDAAAKAHDERSGALGPRGFDRAAALTASRFNLLDETELEFSLDLEDFARQIKDATEDVLSRVHLRYLALLDLRASELSEVPVGPEAVTDALRTLVETENLAIEERTLLLKSWRSPLIEDLRHYYRNLDKELESLGVAASSRGRVNNSTTAPPSAVRIPSPARNDLFGTEPDAMAEGSRITQNSQATQAAGNGDIPDRLVRHLLLGETANDDEPPFSMLSKAQLKLLAPEIADGVELMQTVFLQLTQDDSLPPRVRELLPRLYPALLDATIADQNLSGGVAPAIKRLIDGLAEACDSLPYADGTHQGYKALEGIITEVLAGGKPDRAKLDHAHVACKALLTRRRGSTSTRSQAAVPFAQKAERREGARLFASRAIQVLINKNDCNASNHFLIKHWVHVLTNTLYRKGDRHPDWSAQLALTNQISLMEKPESTVQPDLRASVFAALESAGLSSKALASAKSDFDLIGQGAASMLMPVIANPLSMSLANENRTLVLLHHRGFAMDLEQDASTDIPEIGTWLDITLPSGESVTACVEWIGKTGRAVLFTDPDKSLHTIMTKRAFRELESGGQIKKRAAGGAFSRNLKNALNHRQQT